MTQRDVSFESQRQARVILGITEELSVPRESFRDGWSRVILGNEMAESLLAFPGSSCRSAA